MRRSSSTPSARRSATRLACCRSCGPRRAWPRRRRCCFNTRWWRPSGASLGAVTREIGARTGHRYAVNDWRDMNRQLFSMLEIQQLVLFVVIGLIVFVSTFNIVSTLIMTVHEKRKEIGILTSMGAEPRTIRWIFLWYGSMVGFFGTALGVILGVVICWIVTRFQLVSFP